MSIPSSQLQQLQFSCLIPTAGFASRLSCKGSRCSQCEPVPSLFPDTGTVSAATLQEDSGSYERNTCWCTQQHLICHRSMLGEHMQSVPLHWAVPIPRDFYCYLCFVQKHLVVETWGSQLACWQMAAFTFASLTLGPFIQGAHLITQHHVPKSLPTSFWSALVGLTGEMIFP